MICFLRWPKCIAGLVLAVIYCFWLYNWFYVRSTLIYGSGLSVKGVRQKFTFEYFELSIAPDRAKVTLEMNVDGKRYSLEGLDFDQVRQLFPNFENESAGDSGDYLYGDVSNGVVSFRFGNDRKIKRVIATYYLHPPIVTGESPEVAFALNGKPPIRLPAHKGLVLTYFGAPEKEEKEDAIADF